MRLLSLFVPALVALTLLGCGSSTSPDETGGLPYPDIAGLVAFYQFDGDLTDSAPDSLHAESARDPIYIADHNGVAASAVYVDGAADTISVPSRGAFDFADEFTFAAWVRADLPPYAYASIIDKGFADGGYSLGVVGGYEPDTTALVLYVNDEEAWVQDAVPMGTGDWTHVACTFENPTGAVQFFVNGDLLDADTWDLDLGTSDHDLRIGTSWWRDAFRGGIDQVAIFDRVLSAAEIRELYEFD
jgi:hypothetical protein